MVTVAMKLEDNCLLAGKLWQIWSEVEVKSLRCVWLFATPQTVAYQAPPSMGFFQVRILEWVAISFSRRSSWPRDWTQVSRIVGRHFTVWATREVKYRQCIKTNIDSVLKSRGIIFLTNVHIVKAMVFPVVTYGCESWIIKKAEY